MAVEEALAGAGGPLAEAVEDMGIPEEFIRGGSAATAAATEDRGVVRQGKEGLHSGGRVIEVSWLLTLGLPQQQPQQQ